MNIFNNLSPKIGGDKGRKTLEWKNTPVDIIKGKKPVMNSVITANVGHN